MKKQQEIDLLYEIMRKKNPGNRGKEEDHIGNVTFDYDGKIIPIVQLDPNKLPESLTMPKV